MYFDGMSKSEIALWAFQNFKRVGNVRVLCDSLPIKDVELISKNEINLEKFILRLSLINTYGFNIECIKCSIVATSCIPGDFGLYEFLIDFKPVEDNRKATVPNIVYQAYFIKINKVHNSIAEIIKIIKDDTNE